MRTFSFFALAAIFGLCVICSCVKDDDNHAEASVTFIGTLSQLTYSTDDEQSSENSPEWSESDTLETEVDSVHAFDFSSMITTAFEKLEVIGEKSQITEQTKVDNNSIAYAQYLCAVQATPRIQKKIDQISIEDIRQQIFNNNIQEMNDMGFNSPNDIPVRRVNVTFLYYFSVSGFNPIAFEKAYF